MQIRLPNWNRQLRTGNPNLWVLVSESGVYLQMAFPANSFNHTSEQSGFTCGDYRPLTLTAANDLRSVISLFDILAIKYY